MFLHLKKRRPCWAKESTWLPVTVSCGIITGVHLDCQWHLLLKVCLTDAHLNVFLLFRTYPQSLMHCYEVIPEGAVCKLYFDLEFYRPSNIGVDGQSMVSSLIQVSHDHNLLSPCYFVCIIYNHIILFSLLYCVDSTYVKSWRRFMGSNALPEMSSILTRAPRTSSVAILSSTSPTQLSKTTFMLVCSFGKRQKIFTCLVYFTVFFSVGRFIHKILEHVRNKHESCLDVLPENREIRLVFHSLDNYSFHLGCKNVLKYIQYV